METHIKITTSLSNPFEICDLTENILELTGYNDHLYLDRKEDFFSQIFPEDLPRVESQIHNAIRSPRKCNKIDDFRIIDIYNQVKYLKAYVVINNENVILQLDDVTVYYDKIEEFNDTLYRYNSLKKTLGIGIWDWNVKTGYVYYSKGWKELLGYGQDELQGTFDEWKELLHPEDVDLAMDALESHITGKTAIYESIYRLKKKDGSFIWVEDKGVKKLNDQGDIVRMTGAYRDISDEKKIRGNLEKMIITDELTGLFNRRHYDAQIRDEMLRAERYKGDLSILMIDIDLFKKINDTYGHREGDKALKELARVIKNKIRNTDSAYRTGGEEFVVIAPETNEQNAMRAAERLREAVSQIKLQSNYETFSFTISLGVTTYKNGDTYSSLNERADIALYKSKDSGRNCANVCS